MLEMLGIAAVILFTAALTAQPTPKPARVVAKVRL